MTSTPAEGSGRSRFIRLSDAERNTALESLGEAFAEGRLSVHEYDERCKELVQAQTVDDLDALFLDIPQNADGTSLSLVPQFTINELARANKQSRNVRAGIMALTVIGAAIGSAALSPISGTAVAVIWWLVPLVAVLLYVLKVGPESWYVPSPKKLQKQEIKVAKKRLALEKAQRRSERMTALNNLSTDAMEAARQPLRRLSQPQKRNDQWHD